MKMKGLVFSFATMASLAGVAQAHEEIDNSGKFTVLFGGGKYFADGDRNIDDGKIGEIGLGYIIDKHWAVEAIYSKTSGIGSDTTGADVDVDMYRLDALYHFDQNGHWTPYLAAGVGELNFDPRGSSSSDETAVNFGGGVKYALSPALSLRGDVRAVYGDDDNDVDTLATVAFNYVFGSEAAPAVAPAPVVPKERCPGTPAGVAVDVNGCALDSDRDGVADYKDKCPNTKAGLKVDADGCPIMSTDTVKIEVEALFDTDKAIVKPIYKAEIQRVASFMNTYPKTTAVIEGHTDSVGTNSYNLGLSQRRADAVRNVLVEELKIDANRLTAKGFGEERPVASNATPEGREMNRRVTAVVSANVEKPVQK